MLLCFLSIGVYWLSRHYSGRIYTRSDHVFSVINLGFLLAVTVLPYPLRIWCYHVGTAHEATASIVMATGLVVPGLFWMGKWFYALPDRRLMDRRLTDEFLAQLTRRYSIAVGVELVAIPLAALSPRAGVGCRSASSRSFSFRRRSRGTGTGRRRRRPTSRGLDQSSDSSLTGSSRTRVPVAW